MGLSDDLHSIPRLVGDAVEQLAKLVQNEAQLARTELSEKLAQAGTGAAYLAAAGIFAIPVLGSKLIKSTIPGRRPSRRRPGSFAPIYRSGWQCV